MEKEKVPAQPMRISILLPTNAYFMSGIRDFTMTFIKNATSFSEQWAYRFQSIVDELCNNAIEYGSSPGQDIKLTLTYSPETSLSICVEDTGTGNKKITADELQKLIDERRKPGYVNTGIRGRGLANIIVNWSDGVTFEDLPSGGLKVTATKNLDKVQDDIAQDQAKKVSEPGHLVLTE
ncbi:MAG: ATP-binding protein [Candidatus Peregrinibacteria bacterium]|nr:ATP-binding protein [Candidatus Peregrinibacteria bacterium]